MKPINDQLKVTTKRAMRKEKALHNSEQGRNTPPYFTIGGNGLNDFGKRVGPPKSFKAGRNNIIRNKNL